MVQATLVVLTDYPAIIRHLSGDWESDQETPMVDVWDSGNERWHTQLSSEPHAVARWFKTILVRKSGYPATPGAGRRISFLQRDSFNEWRRQMCSN